MSLESELSACALALRNGPDDKTLYKAVDGALGRLIGHKLFTLLIAVDGGTFVQRVYSSNEAAYPLFGRKAMGPTPWGDHVLKGKKNWMGNDADAIRWAFPDHELIASLGLASCINIPVMAFGRVVGTMNLLDEANAYTDEKMRVADLFAPFVVLPFTEEAARTPA